ncbi:MAG: hypothetical protein R3Y64_11210 [Peptostreptococcaceae bacterium]
MRSIEMKINVKLSSGENLSFIEDGLSLISKDCSMGHLFGVLENVEGFSDIELKAIDSILKTKKNLVSSTKELINIASCGEGYLLIEDESYELDEYEETLDVHSIAFFEFENELFKAVAFL